MQTAILTLFAVIVLLIAILRIQQKKTEAKNSKVAAIKLSGLQDDDYVEIAIRIHHCKTEQELLHCMRRTVKFQDMYTSFNGIVDSNNLVNMCEEKEKELTAQAFANPAF